MSPAPSPASSPSAPVVSKHASFVGGNASSGNSGPVGKEGWLYREVESAPSGGHKVSAAHKEHHTAKVSFRGEISLLLRHWKT